MALIVQTAGRVAANLAARILGERRARACTASTASTTLPSSACPGHPPGCASVVAVTDLAAADLAPRFLHPDLALLSITPVHHVVIMVSSADR